MNSLDYSCFAPDCQREFEDLEEMIPLAGKGNRSPRHFCPDCAERIRRGPPLF